MLDPALKRCLQDIKAPIKATSRDFCPLTRTRILGA